MGCCATRIITPNAVATARLPSMVETLSVAYGKPVVQHGFTDGHNCITNRDKEIAVAAGASLLYGEILPNGITKLLDEDHLRAGHARVLYDLGAGTAFLQYQNLFYVLGVEISPSRFQLAERAIRRLVESQPRKYHIERHLEGEIIRVDQGRMRTLELRCGDMWRTKDIHRADVVVLHTEFTTASLAPFRRFLEHMRVGSRFVTYQDLAPYWPEVDAPFEQLAVNIDETDTFATSWAGRTGHHLFCWEKIRECATGFLLHEDDLESEEEKEEEDEAGIKRPRMLHPPEQDGSEEMPESED